MHRLIDSTSDSESDSDSEDESTDTSHDDNKDEDVYIPTNKWGANWPYVRPGVWPNGLTWRHHIKAKKQVKLFYKKHRAQITVVDTEQLDYAISRLVSGINGRGNRIDNPRKRTK